MKEGGREAALFLWAIAGYSYAACTVRAAADKKNPASCRMSEDRAAFSLMHQRQNG